jgi:hypothetical protein
VSARRAAACLAELHAAGYRAAEIGVVDLRRGVKPIVRLDPSYVAPPELAAAK